MSETENGGVLEELRAQIGVASAPEPARDPVNQPMIRHWCDAMDDHNPVYTDPEYAAKSVHGAIVAPPTMLNAWTMSGLVSRRADSKSPMASILSRLGRAGYTSVVATNSEHEYPRYLRLGDHLVGVSSIEDVSPEKQTALGVGHFVSTVTEYRNQEGELVGRMRFRILKFKPGTGRSAPCADADSAPKPHRPRPGISRDTEFFWKGIEEDELRIQRCNSCARLHHPPVVRCPDCGGYEFGHQVASGKGRVYSFVEPCHPRLPSFDTPYLVGLIELEEGTRLISNIVDIDPAAVEIDMPVELVIRRPDPELALPMFRPRRPVRREATLCFEEVEVGQDLPPWSIPITTTSIVAGAIASRDYQDVHHDPELARLRGSPDIFMNILTTSGLCGCYLSDWAGPEALMRSLAIRLGAPNYPHDTMTMSGSVLSAKEEASKLLVEVGVRGTNRIGDHVTGRAILELPGGSAR
jgi:uncharacterized OB-fold protein